MTMSSMYLEMSSIVFGFPIVRDFPTRQRLCLQLQLHHKTIQKHAHSFGNWIGEKPAVRFRRIDIKPHALDKEVSLKEPKVNYSFDDFLCNIFLMGLNGYHYVEHVKAIISISTLPMKKVSFMFRQRISHLS